MTDEHWQLLRSTGSAELRGCWQGGVHVAAAELRRLSWRGLLTGMHSFQSQRRLVRGWSGGGQGVMGGRP